MNVEALKSHEQYPSSTLKEKGVTRWRLVKAGIWGGISLVVVAALFRSAPLGVLAGIIGGVVSYNKASVKT